MCGIINVDQKFEKNLLMAINLVFKDFFVKIRNNQSIVKHCKKYFYFKFSNTRKYEETVLKQKNSNEITKDLIKYE